MGTGLPQGQAVQDFGIVSAFILQLPGPEAVAYARSQLLLVAYKLGLKVVQTVGPTCIASCPTWAQGPGGAGSLFPGSGQRSWWQISQVRSELSLTSVPGVSTCS